MPGNVNVNGGKRGRHCSIRLDFFPGGIELDYKAEKAHLWTTMSHLECLTCVQEMLGLRKFRPGTLHFQSLIAGRLAKCLQKSQIKILFNNNLFTSRILLSQTNIYIKKLLSYNLASITK